MAGVFPLKQRTGHCGTQPSGPAQPRRRALLRTAWVLLAALPLSACLGAGAAPSLQVSMAQINEALSGQFPRSIALGGGLLVIEVQTPTLTPLPADNRLRLHADMQLRLSFLPRSYAGALTLESGLRYEASDHSIRTHDLRVQSIRVEGLPAPAQTLLQQQGLRLAEQALQNARLHSLGPSALERLQALGLEPGAITVTAQGLQVDWASTAAQTPAPRRSH